MALEAGGAYRLLAAAHFGCQVPNCYDLTWATSVVTRAWQKLREALDAEGKSQWLDEL